jgi:MFS family permease
VILLGLTSFFTDAASDMIFPLLPIFLGSLGAGAAFLGLVEGIADATASLLKLVSGYLADRTPRRKPLIVLGYGLAAVAKPLIALATAPWHVLTVRVADRIGKGIRSAPRDVVIASAAVPGQAGRAFGFHRAMDHAGAVVGPLVATALLGLGLGLRSIFWIAAVPSALSVLCVLLVREPKPKPDPSIARDATPAPRSRERLPARLRSYFAILLLFSIGNSSDAFLLLRATNLGIAPAVLPILWTVLHVSKLTSSYLGGGWSDRVPRGYLIAAGWIVYATTYVGLAFADQAWHAWALFVVYGTYYGLTEPAEKALVKDLAHDAVRGRAFGYYNFVVGISAVPASLLTGWLWQAHGPALALTTGAGLAGLSAVLRLIWSSRD